MLWTSVEISIFQYKLFSSVDNEKKHKVLQKANVLPSDFITFKVVF